MCGRACYRCRSVVQKAQAAGKGFNCSPACRAEYTKTLRGPKSAKYARVSVQCAHCGKHLERPANQVQAHGHQFCDRVCSGAWKKTHPSLPKKTAPSACLTCGKEFYAKPYAQRRGRGKYCSRSCYADSISLNNSGDNHPLWLGGGVEYRGPNWSKQRTEARKRDGNRCRNCNASARLHVHHIRPFRSFGYIVGVNDAYLAANELSNLITLCASCHRKAERGKVALPTID
ncbi:HNH endonuclease [Deinococcus carri]